MSFRPDHEIYKRRFSRNLGVGLTLAAFVAAVFAMTVVKVSEAGPIAGAVPAVKAGVAAPEKTQ